MSKIERRKIKIDEEEIKHLFWGGSDDFEIIKEIATGEQRWFTCYDFIFKELSTGDFFRGHFRRAKSEMGEHEYNNEITQVFPIEKVVIDYE